MSLFPESEPFKVLVCGGRNFSDHVMMFEALDGIHHSRPISLLIHGDAPGADRLSGAWADQRGIQCAKYPANWTAHGLGAGARRNSMMLQFSNPDLVVAFPGGDGTDDMMKKARSARVPVTRVGAGGDIVE